MLPRDKVGSRYNCELFTPCWCHASHVSRELIARNSRSFRFAPVGMTNLEFDSQRSHRCGEVNPKGNHASRNRNRDRPQ